VKFKFYLEFIPSDRRLQPASDGRIFLNVHDFVKALRFAFDIFSETMINNEGDVRENALAHKNEYPVLSETDK
jgi:hypothetical protein